MAEENECDMIFEEEQKQVLQKSSITIPFITTLYKMIQEENQEENGYIKWCEEDNGQSFIITDAITFSKILLPKYYKHTNFCGFSRQLSLYGFKKFDGEYRFQHEKFMKDRQDLLKTIQRKKPQSQRKKISNTTKLYQQLLTQLMSIQKQNLDTSQQISILKETLYSLKVREENLEMRLQRMQDTTSLDPSFQFFSSSTGSTIPNVPMIPNTSHQFPRIQEESIPSGTNPPISSHQPHHESHQQHSDTQHQSNTFMNWNEHQPSSHIPWKF